MTAPAMALARRSSARASSLADYRACPADYPTFSLGELPHCLVAGATRTVASMQAYKNLQYVAAQGWDRLGVSVLNGIWRVLCRLRGTNSVLPFL